MKILDSLWSLFLVGSVRAGVLILVVLLLRAVLRERVPAQCFHLLWLLVALRLFMPIAPGSAWSIFNLFSGSNVTNSVKAEQWRVRLGGEIPIAVTSGIGAGEPIGVARPQIGTISSRDAIPLVWLFGIALQAVLLARSAARMRRSLHGVRSTCDPRILALVAECELPRKLIIVETDLVTGPAVMGFWRPRLLLPRGLAMRLSDEELRFVFMHECAHLRRRDLVALWFLTMARVLHWFNPLVWIAVRVARTDAELACDEAVLRRTRADRSVVYGETLLKLAQIVTWQRPLLPAAGIVESKRAMRTRLARIGCYREKTRRHLCLTALVVIGVGLSFGADEKATVSQIAEIESKPAASTGLPDWAKGWSVVWISFPPQGSDLQSQVDLQKPDGVGVSLTVGEQSDDGVKLVDVAWINSPMATALITLEKEGARVVLSAPSEIVSRRGGEVSKKPHIEIESRFFELSEIDARRLSVLPGGSGRLDRTGIELLGARLKGVPTSEVLTEVQCRDFLQSIGQKKGVDLLSAPKVTTKVGQRAVIEIIREFRYPTEFEAVPGVTGGWNPKTFETRNCGVTLEALPELNEAGAIALKLTPQVVDFLGFHDIDTGKKYPVKSAVAKALAERMSGSMTMIQRYPTRPGRRVLPTFSSRKIETDVTLLPGSAVLIVGIGETENAEGFPSRAKSHRLAVLVSANLVNPQDQPIARSKAPDAAVKPAPQDAETPKGVLVPDRPGFVRSPFAPEGGFVDVRGFPSGTQVRCPSSKKIFLVP